MSSNRSNGALIAGLCAAVVVLLIIVVPLFTLDAWGGIHWIKMWAHTSPQQFWWGFGVGCAVLIIALITALSNTMDEGGVIFACGLCLSVVAWLAVIGLGQIHKADHARSDLLKSSKVEKTPTFLQVTDKRRVPKVVADEIAATRFNRPGFSLTDGHLARNCAGEWVWTYIQTPKRTWKRNTGGIVQVSAEHVSAPVKQFPTPGTEEYASFKFKVGPNMKLTDGATWRFRSDVDLYSEVNEWIGVIPCKGEPYIISPVIKYEGGGVKHPTWAGVVILRPNGSFKSLTPQQAQQNPDIARTGHIYPETLARQVAESYKYVNGVKNQYGGWWHRGDHKDVFLVQDDGSNPQPYLLEGADGRSYWVTMMSPWKSGRSLGAIMYTDAVSGKSKVWWAPPGRTFIDNSRALSVARSLSLPGINFTDFQAVEPHPIITKGGKLYYLVSIVPNSNSNVSKAVVVDAELASITALFDYETDGNAEDAIKQFLETGEIPEGYARRSVGTGPALPQKPGQGEKPQPTPATPVSPSPSTPGSPGVGVQLTPAQTELLLRTCRKDPACRKQVLESSK